MSSCFLRKLNPGAGDSWKPPLQAGGMGQTRLYNICKAYSVYDEEVGYCQGLSFIAAVLLLHMPEEEAFCLFIKFMYAPPPLV